MNLDITTILAIYGAVLATLVLVWDIVKFVRERPRLKVEGGHHVLMGEGSTEHRLGIKMSNVGKGKITIEASGLKFLPPLQNGNMATIYDVGLPKELDEGQSHTSYLFSATPQPGLGRQRR
jgi:hypothetical protein